MDKFAEEFKDSGERREFETGAVRDKATGKGRFDLVSPVGLRRLAIIYEKGCIKYADRNWEKGIPVSAFIDSAARHINEYLAGEKTEDNLAMACWNLFGAMHMEERRPDLVDIPARAPLFNMPKLKMTDLLLNGTGIELSILLRSGGLSTKPRCLSIMKGTIIAPV